MANKKIENKDLIDKDFLDHSIKKFEDILKVTNLTIEAFAELGEQAIKIGKSKPFEGYSNLKDISKSIEQINKAVKGLTKAEAEQVKLQTKLADLRTQQAKANKAVKEQIVAENEAVKESVKKHEKLVSAFDKEKKRLNDLKKEYKEQAITLGENSDEAQGLLVEITKLNDSINAIEKSTKSVTREIKELTVAETEQEKLKKRLAKLSTQESKDNEVIKQQIIAERKVIKEQAKERGGLINIYQKESKRLDDLRKEYKNLALSEGTTSQKAKELLKQVVALDKELKDLDASVGQNQRSVGDYGIALKSLNKVFGGTIKRLNRLEKELDDINGVFKKLGVIAILVKLLEGFQGALANNTEGTANFDKAMGRITVTFAVFLNRLVKGLPVIKALLNDFFVNSRIAVIEFNNDILNSVNKFGLLDKKIGENLVKIIELRKELSGKEFEDFSNIFKGITDEVSKTIEANDKFIDSVVRNRKAIIELNKRIGETGRSTLEFVDATESLIEAEQRLEVASGDNTLSLAEREVATQQLIKAQREMGKVEVEIARLELDTASKRVRAQVGNLDAKEAEVQALLNLAMVTATANREIQDSEKELKEIRSDDAQIRLDFLIDNFDATKTANEKIIEDETQTFKKRNELLKENERLAEQSYEGQKRVLNDFLTIQGKATVDFDELRKNTDDEAVANQLKNAGFSEALTTRALELLREKKIVNSDLMISQKELSESESESNKTLAESILIQEAINKSKEKGADLDAILLELSEKILESEIDNLKLRIATLQLNREVTDKAGEAEVEAQKQLNAKLLEQAKTKADKEKDIETDKQAKLAEIRQLGIDGVRAIAEKNLEATTANIDKEISALESREATLRELASRGVENVENNLALEQKRRAELEAKRAQAVKRQQQIELGLAVLETYSNKVGAGDKNALASTITDTSLLLSFISSLPAFYEGTEDTGKAPKGIDANGGRVAILHDNERVMTARQNAMIPDSMSNLDLATMAQMSDKGMRLIAVNDNSEVVKGLQDLKIAIESKPVYDFKYDDVKKAVADVVESRGRRETSWRKNDGFF